MTKEIISWNVNGIRAVEKKGFLDWLFKESPDVLCLQETKAKKEQLNSSLINPSSADISYKTYWSSAIKPGYSGVAIFSKEEPKNVQLINVKEIDDEGRILVAEFKEFSVISSYFPNSQEAGLRLPYKLFFCDEILKLCNKIKEKTPIILCGDYNIAHKPIDLANPERNQGNPGYLPEEREWMTSFIEAGYKDTFREFCNLPQMYTWWSYRFSAREKNIGWRLDYSCVNDEFMGNVTSSTIMSDVMGSDHCPIKLKINV
ncbi:MAG: exodeoxyribonuclease III [Treponema sp.]